MYTSQTYISIYKPFIFQPKTKHSRVDMVQTHSLSFYGSSNVLKISWYPGQNRIRLRCYHLNETSLGDVLHNTIYYPGFTKKGIFCEFFTLSITRSERVNIKLKLTLQAADEYTNNTGNPVIRKPRGLYIYYGISLHRPVNNRVLQFRLPIE